MNFIPNVCINGSLYASFLQNFPEFPIPIANIYHCLVMEPLPCLIHHSSFMLILYALFMGRIYG